MNFIDVAGGLGNGLAAGMQDQREQQLAQARLGLMRQQQDLGKTQLAEAQRQDALRQKLAGVQPAGTSTVQQQGPMPDGSNIPPQTVTRTQADVMRDQAGIVGQGDPTAGARLYEAARGNDYQDRMDALAKSYAQQHAMINQDPGSWADTHGVTGYNDQNTAGHIATSWATPDGGRLFTVHDSATMAPVGAHYISPDDLAQFSHDHLNRQYMGQLMTMVPPEQAAKIYEATTNADLKGAQAKEAGQRGSYFDAEAQGIPARNKALQDTANAHLLTARAAQDRNDIDKTTPLGITVNDDDGSQNANFLQRGRGGVSVQSVRLPGMSTKKAPPELDTDLKKSILQDWQTLPGSGPKRAQGEADIRGRWGSSNVDQALGLVRRGQATGASTNPISEIAAALNKKGAPGAKAAPVAQVAPTAATASPRGQDPGAQKFQREDSEIQQGVRDDYSPETKVWLQQKQVSDTAASRAQQAQTAADYDNRQQALQRALRGQ